MSRHSAEEGFNQFATIDDLPLDQDQKEMVLEWFAQKIWRTFEDDFHCKRYDPLIIDGVTAHSYVFNFEDGGRHHPFKSLKHLEEMLIEEMKGYAGYFILSNIENIEKGIKSFHEGISLVKEDS